MKEKLRIFLDNHKEIESPFWGKIIIDSQLGEGGNGLVYGATMREKKVAIKFLTTEESLESKKKRFYDEYVNALFASLEYGVKYYHADCLDLEDGTKIPYIVMKCYLENLSKWRESQLDSSPETAKKIFEFLLNAVEELEDKGIIHRDIKPENILVEDSNTFVLSDFGIACFDSQRYKNLHKTDKNERLGNRFYSAPEQDNPKCKPSVTMDIYALGQVFHFWVTGHPHKGSDDVNFPALPEYNDIITRCLRHDPVDRFQNVADIRRAIEQNKHSKIFQENAKQAITAILDFDKAIRQCFPKHYNISHITDPGKIKMFFEYLKNTHLISYLRRCWLVNYYDDFDQNSNINQIKNQLWRFNHDLYSIQEIWIVTDDKCCQRDNDAILVHHVSYGYQGPSEEYFYDGLPISAEEESNGYLAQEDKPGIKINPDKMDYVLHNSNDGYFLLGTRWQRFQTKDNENRLNLFLSDLSSGKLPPDNEVILRKVHEFRYGKMEPEIAYSK